MAYERRPHPKSIEVKRPNTNFVKASKSKKAHPIKLKRFKK